MNRLLDIGAALVAARRAQGMTQQDLGALVGASQQQVARWEARAYANVDLERASQVADALGVTTGAQPLLVAEPGGAYAPAPRAAGPRPRSRLEFSPAELRAVCRRRAVKRLALFGSVLRDDFGPESDIDVLVEFDDERFESSEIQRLPEELSEVFGGREVDLVEAEFLNPRLRERVLAEAWSVFAA